MATFSRRHYEPLVKLLRAAREHPAEQQLPRFTEMLADMLSADNRSFDRERFAEEAGMSDSSSQ